MVTSGFSRIHVAKYAADGAAVTYSGCKELARAKSMTTEITASEDNHFYANNQIAETEPASFKSGTVKVVVDGLNAEEEALILGLTESTVTVGEEEIPVVQYGADMNAPYLGLGAIKRMQLNNVVSYRPIILTKIRFAIPGDSAETQEDVIGWQTQELSATIMRDDTANHNWKMIPKQNFETEEAAIAFIQAVLGGAAA